MSDNALNASILRINFESGFFYYLKRRKHNVVCVIFMFPTVQTQTQQMKIYLVKIGRRISIKSDEYLFNAMLHI